MRRSATRVIGHTPSEAASPRQVRLYVRALPAGEQAIWDCLAAGELPARPGFKPFHVPANSGSLANRKDVFATIASTSGPKYAAHPRRSTAGGAR